MGSRRWKLLVAVWLASPFLSHCGGGSSPPDGGNGGDGDSDCAVVCTTTADCCSGMACVDGICATPTACPSGCNWECDKAAGQVCNRSRYLCEDGAPPVNCLDDCDCFSGEVCEGGVCLPANPIAPSRSMPGKR